MFILAHRHDIVHSVLEMSNNYLHHWQENLSLYLCEHHSLQHRNYLVLFMEENTIYFFTEAKNIDEDVDCWKNDGFSWATFGYLFPIFILNPHKICKTNQDTKLYAFVLVFYRMYFLRKFSSFDKVGVIVRSGDLVWRIIFGNTPLLGISVFFPVLLKQKSVSDQ